MMLNDYITTKGGTFFKLRSYTPLLLVPLLYLQRANFRYPFESHAADMSYELGCLLVSLTGIFIRVFTIGYVPEGTSGRNTKRQKADRLNTTGLYSIVRNPLYVGNYLVLIGITLLSQSWELVVVNSFLFLVAYVPIIMTEENFLLSKFGGTYADYVERVPCLIPRLRLWTPPNQVFSVRMVLHREHDTWFSLVLSFVLVEHYREYIITEAPKLEPGWLILGGVGLFSWLLIKSLKHWTHLLDSKESDL